MSTYGFPWPDMLACDKFPVDNDMCITSQSEKRKASSRPSSGGVARGSSAGKDGRSGRSCANVAFVFRRKKSDGRPR